MQRYLTNTLLIVALLIAGCTKSATSQSSASPSAEWPSYAATDYSKPGQPTLRASQVGLIRKTLALTTPCQAAQLRYAFPRSGSDLMVLYFQTVPSSGTPHVLWTYNTSYDPTTGIPHPVPYDSHPGPKGIGTAYEVQHWRC